MTRTPLIIFGDAPGTQSGLSRIATDLAARIQRYLSDVFDVRSVGWGPWANLPTHGVAQSVEARVDGDVTGWPGWVYGDFESRGIAALHTAYRTWFGARPGIVLTIWDAARCDVVRATDLPVQWWGYVPIDAENQHGAISGPAKANLERFDRLLAYGPYGARVLANTIPTWETDAIHRAWLPHGIDTRHVWTPYDPPNEARAQTLLGGAQLPADATFVGCVAVNQRRKDLGMYCQVLAKLTAVDPSIYGWLHTDKIVGDAWSIPQLVLDCGLSGRLAVTQNLTDRELAACYRKCAVTIAPGRGEGFGYPILESLALGVPVLHVEYAGGADLLPWRWLSTPLAYQLEGVYAEKRPVLDVNRFVAQVESALAVRWQDNREEVRTYAEPYEWRTLWPKWAAWLTAAVPEAR